LKIIITIATGLKCKIFYYLLAMKSICLLLVVFVSTFMSSTAQAANSYSKFLFQDTASPIVLPVHWLDFTAVQKEKSVFLKWSTLHEQGIMRFKIERSNKGNEFREIGTAIANGNSSTFLEYQFEDLQPIPGISYYRVTCEDENGFRTMSLIRKINYQGRLAHPLELRNIYVTGKTIHLTPVFFQHQQSWIYIYSQTGKLALKAMVNTHTSQVQASNLKEGIYFLSTGFETSPIILRD